MKRLLLPSIIFIFLLASCYPQHRVLFRWPDGSVKVIRYYRHHDSLDEKLVRYYQNRRKEYVKYWKNDLEKYKMETWYENGIKESYMHSKFKDTVRVRNPKDSTWVLRGYIKQFYIEWNDKGVIQRKVFNKNGKMYRATYNDQGVCVQNTMEKTIRPDNYDTIEVHGKGKAIQSYKGYYNFGFK